MREKISEGVVEEVGRINTRNSRAGQAGTRSVDAAVSKMMEGTASASLEEVIRWTR